MLLIVVSLVTENAVRLSFIPATENEPCQACAWSDDGTYFAWCHNWSNVTVIGPKCIK